MTESVSSGLEYECHSERSLQAGNTVLHIIHLCCVSCTPIHDQHGDCFFAS